MIMDAQSHSDIKTGHLLSILLFVDAKALLVLDVAALQKRTDVES